MASGDPDAAQSMRRDLGALPARENAKGQDFRQENRSAFQCPSAHFNPTGVIARKRMASAHE